MWYITLSSWLPNFNRVPAFEATKYKITNRDFYEFVKIGGYGKRDLWTDEG